MALVRCPICGEEYSDSYDECPFCEEEEVMTRGAQIRRTGNHRGGKRAAGGQMNILTPTLAVLIVIMAALLVYLLFGDTIMEKLGWGGTPGTETVEPLPEITPPGQTDPMNPDLPLPDVPDAPDEPVTEEPPVSSGMDYAAAAALPKGLSLILKVSATLTAS